MPSSVRFGSRARLSFILAYSPGVRPCCSMVSGVMVCSFISRLASCRKNKTVILTRLESDVDLRGVCDNGAVFVMDNTAQKNFSAAIERNPDIVSGALVFRGTRVPVAALFGNLKD